MEDDFKEKKKKCKGWNCNAEGVEIVSMKVVLYGLMFVFLLILFQVYRMYTSCKHPASNKWVGKRDED